MKDKLDFIKIKNSVLQRTLSRKEKNRENFANNLYIEHIKDNYNSIIKS